MYLCGMKPAIIHQFYTEISEICRESKVSRLYIFGSATNDKFNEESDLDFLVEFTEQEPVEYAETYFTFCEKLEALLSRNIDVTTVRSLKNPYFKQMVDAQKELIYQRA